MWEVTGRLGKGLGEEDVRIHLLGKLSGLESQLRAGDHELAKKSRISLWDFWWSSGNESACQCTGCGLTPVQEPRSYMPRGQLSSWTVTTEPMCSEPMFCNRRSQQDEKLIHCDGRETPI